jgi:hypothetical protein
MNPELRMTPTVQTPSFSDLPDDARLWVFAASRPLTSEESTSLLARVDGFLAGWHAHGHAVVGARDLRLDQFLLIAADERATGVSGCSIDSLYRVLKEAEHDLGVGLLDASLVFYRDGDGAVRAASRPDFRELLRDGGIDEDTPVFDNTVRSVGDLRNEAWEKPLRSSWHARAFLSRS